MKDNLLITTIGKYNHFSAWIDGERDYDIAVVNYDGSEQPKVSDTTCIYHDTFHTFKYPGIKEMFAREPWLWNYKYFWMPDEDIWAKPDMVNEIFYNMEKFNLWLAQPSVLNSIDSFLSWRCFEHKPNIDLIKTNFIEIMCPCFSNKSLRECIETFNKTHSGWGQDLVWSRLGKDKNMAIINSVAIKHTRPVYNGNLYKTLLSNRISPSIERKKLMKEYDIKNIDIRTWM